MRRRRCVAARIRREGGTEIRSPVIRQDDVGSVGSARVRLTTWIENGVDAVNDGQHSARVEGFDRIGPIGTRNTRCLGHDFLPKKIARQE